MIDIWFVFFLILMYNADNDICYCRNGWLYRGEADGETDDYIEVLPVNTGMGLKDRKILKGFLIWRLSSWSGKWEEINSDWKGRSEGEQLDQLITSR